MRQAAARAKSLAENTRRLIAEARDLVHTCRNSRNVAGLQRALRQARRMRETVRHES